MTRRGLFLLAALLTAARAEAGELTVHDAWARASIGPTGAVYLRIDNATAATARLLGAETPVATEVMPHVELPEADGTRMLALSALDIPPGETVTLRPLGIHLMLTGLAHRLRQGETFPLTLRFADAPPLRVTVRVAAPGALQPPGDAP
jgi:hypothetical protein